MSNAQQKPRYVCACGESNPKKLTTYRAQNEPGGTSMPYIWAPIYVGPFHVLCESCGADTVIAEPFTYNWLGHKRLDFDEKTIPVARRYKTVSTNKCPSCKSNVVRFISPNRKDFDLGKAIAGGIIAGIPGTLVGFLGKDDGFIFQCEDCHAVFVQPTMGGEKIVETLVPISALTAVEIRNLPHLNGINPLTGEFDPKYDHGSTPTTYTAEDKVRKDAIWRNKDLDPLQKWYYTLGGFWGFVWFIFVMGVVGFVFWVLNDIFGW